MSNTSNLPELSGFTTAVVSFLSAVAVLALRAISMILRRITSGEKAPFQKASIEWGSYRILVSKHRRSGLSKSGVKATGARASGSTAGRKAKVASFYSVQTVLPSQPSSGVTGKPSPSVSFPDRIDPDTSGLA